MLIGLGKLFLFVLGCLIVINMISVIFTGT